MINKKRILVISMLVASAFMTTACAEKSIIENKPVMSTIENLSIDWEQVRDDLEASLNDNPDYPHGKYVDFAVYPEENTIRLIWPLDDKITQIESLDYGVAIIKTFNDIVATQDFSITKSSETSYGSLWDKWKLELEIYNEADIMNPELYYVNQYMEPGSNDPVIPQIRKDVQETEESTSN